MEVKIYMPSQINNWLQLLKTTNLKNTSIWC